MPSSSRLKTVDRPALSRALAEARSHGDISENADYDAAKERQGFIEGRIAEIEHKLAGAQVIDPAAIADAGGHVVFGATVELEDATGDRVTYQIVGEDEADLKHGKFRELPDCACAHWQVGGRHRRSEGAGRRARIRGARGPLQLTPGGSPGLRRSVRSAREAGNPLMR